ncbi:hypothetical protein HYC85_022101 [Camellia sinensis]|uniref:Uncharacterized protein n=1 Tax=Camellia sinensis TaxID=4442 RepID=A0A7J7GNC1_CAMSI|nr:hypothetical protein HYC85_022101 [Camellia sinensis]
MQLCTIPLDTAKVRLQLQKNAVVGDGLASLKYRGMLANQSFMSCVLVEALMLMFSFCVKKFYVGDNFVGDVPLSKKILAALTTGEWMLVHQTGAIAITVANPTDLVKTLLKIPGFTDNVFTHMLSGLGAGFFAVCIGSPVDVVKSRMMGDSTYKITLDCFIKTLKSEGPLAFYKGFIPNFGRLGSWNVIMFLILEQAKMFVRSIESA